MGGQIVIFEGYDGAGKSSLISTISGRLAAKRIRIVGRKAEPDLVPLSRVIENGFGQFPPNAEVLLRFALETARQKIVREASSNNDLVILDRAAPSLLAWIDYHGLQWNPYEPLARLQIDFYRKALLIVCLADFDTCWSRIGRKKAHSAKELLGREINRRYYELYMSNLNRLAPEFHDVIYVDCVGQSLDDSAAYVTNELKVRYMP